MVKMTNAALAPIELKSGEENDAADIVTKAIEDFTATVNDRFAAIEKKFDNDNDAALASRLDKIEARLSRPSAPAIIGKAVDQAEVEKKVFNDFARGVAIDTKQLSVAGTGGVTVPTPLYSELIRNLVLYSPMRSVARVMQVNSDTIKLPKRTANLTSALVAEAAQRPESTPTYDSQTINVYEVGAVSNVTLNMLEDSVFDLANYIMQDIGTEFGREEGALLVNGTGVDQPRGIMHAPAAGSIVNAAGATLAPDDLLKVFYSLPSYYANSGVWLMNRDTVGKIRSFKSTTGEYLWAPGTGENGLVPGTAATLLGRPIVELPDMPNVAPSTISVAFGDVASAYRIIDRISINVLRDDYTMRDKGIVRFHARRRFGGDVVLDEALRFLQTTA